MRPPELAGARTQLNAKRPMSSVITSKPAIRDHRGDADSCLTADQSSLTAYRLRGKSNWLEGQLARKKSRSPHHPAAGSPGTPAEFPGNLSTVSVPTDSSDEAKKIGYRKIAIREPKVGIRRDSFQRCFNRPFVSAGPMGG